MTSTPDLDAMCETLERTGLPVYAAVIRELRKDTERFEWYFNDKPKAAFIPIYMRGLRERWSLGQWRAAIDAAREGP